MGQALGFSNERCYFLSLTLLTPNIARNGIATQISDYNNAARGTPDYASYAIDGDFSTNINGIGRCAHTNGHAGAWWQVDLRKRFQIQKVSITTRDLHSGIKLLFFLKMNVSVP